MCLSIIIRGGVEIISIINAQFVFVTFQLAADLGYTAAI